MRGTTHPLPFARRLASAFLWAALALGSAGCASPPPAPDPLPPAPEMQVWRIERDVTWLAADERGGRGAGTRGLAEAAQYIAGEFRAAGLAPAGEDGDFYQRFEMPVSIRVTQERLRVGGDELEPDEDFGAYATSENGVATGEVVFAGYGITAPHQGWDDYAGVDVKGRIALVLDDRPGGSEGPLGGPHGSGLLLRSEKIANARRHGAWAVLIAPADEQGLEAPMQSVTFAAHPGARPSGVVAMWVSREAAQRIVASGGGASLDELQQAIDASGHPGSRLLEGAQVSAHVGIERKRGTVPNVIGVLHGSDPVLAEEAVVIGAHFDHLGLGPYGSLAPDRAGEVHNGADDNASGTAGLLELARAFAKAPPTRRTLVFVAFAGEELGLNGARAYVENPTLPIERTVAMLNMDMVGRLRDGRLTAFGAETSPDFETLVARAAEGLPVEVLPGEGGFAPSDQTVFYAKEIPVLFFTTGPHAEYHTPEDDAHLIEAEGEADVLKVVYRTARALADADGRPEVMAAAGPAPSAEGGGGSGYGPYLGTVPDFVASPGEGVALQAVRPGSPAEQAGIRAGDRIVEFDGASIANLEEYAARLFSARAGDEVEIVVLRDGERITTRATLGRRR